MNLQNLQISLILMLLLAGCGRNKYEDMQKSDIFNDPSYVQLEVVKGYIKKPHAVHKFTQKDNREFENLEKIDVIDHYVDKNTGYFLTNKQLLVLKMDTYGHTTVDLPSGSWSKIKKTKKGLVIYGKDQKMLLWKPRKGIVEHKLRCIVSRVFGYHGYLAIVFTNGLVMLYDPETKTPIWDTGTAYNQNKTALENAEIDDDKVVFVNATGHLVSVDLDTGEASMTYIKKKVGEANVVVTQSGICAMSGQTILVKLRGSGDYKKQTTISINGLKSIQSRDNYVILEKDDSYIITTANLLFNKQFISKIDKSSDNLNIFIHKKLFGVINRDNVEIYEIGSGDLVQKIPVNGKLRHGVFANNQLLLLVDNSVRVYN